MAGGQCIGHRYDALLQRVTNGARLNLRLRVCL